METKLKAHEEELAKLNGANRLLIEDTDGSSSEDEEIVQIEVKETKKEATNPIQPQHSSTTSLPTSVSSNKSEIENKKQPIKIAEVEDDDEETDESDCEESNSKTVQAAVKKSEVADKIPEIVEKKIVLDVKLELPEKVSKTKDNAFKHFSSGQYGAACELYSKAISELKEAVSINCKFN